MDLFQELVMAIALKAAAYALERDVCHDCRPVSRGPGFRMSRIARHTRFTSCCVIRRAEPVRWSPNTPGCCLLEPHLLAVIV